MSMRIEHDGLGELELPENAYYGIVSERNRRAFDVGPLTLDNYPSYIRAVALCKIACARANVEIGALDSEKAKYIEMAAREVADGKFKGEFVVNIYRGSGTPTNMIVNEVVAHRANELMVGSKTGPIHPNTHVNMCQSTNDLIPTAKEMVVYDELGKVIEAAGYFAEAFEKKAEEFADVIKMGRTQLQDAVPMTLGQEFEAYAATLTEEIDRLQTNLRLFYEINMGATAIGTGINADPDYAELCTKHLREITGLPLSKATNMIEATSDTGAFIMNSSALKRLAVKLSKICNDLRLLSSGPRCGLNEINLPPRQPGSSIMPGKVNPVIPEVVNQVAFSVIGNDLTITLASEAGQLELNVMEPIIVHSLFENIEMLVNAMNTLREKCIVGITANAEVCRRMVYNSIGLVTALNPYLGYETSTMLAKEALQSGKGIYDLVLEHKLMSEEELQKILQPENMVHPRKKITE